jgi:hypothetical protein
VYQIDRHHQMNNHQNQMEALENNRIYIFFFKLEILLPRIFEVIKCTGPSPSTNLNVTSVVSLNKIRRLNAEIYF